MTKVKLTAPVSRKGADPVAEVTVAKPTVGTLRGLKLTDVLQMDVKTMERLLPRITQPALLAEDVAGLDPADFLALAGAVVGFFASADQMAALDPDRP